MTENATAIGGHNPTATGLSGGVESPPGVRPSGTVESPPGVQESRIGPATQFLRIAATMTGGVSLAVWMGGVAREIDLLCQASKWRARLPGGDTVLSTLQPPPGIDPVLPLYLRLLDLLDVAADTDVLSGTSAGGINAALLGYARTCDKDLGGLRDLWTTLGSLGTLLRDPRDSAVPSLMYGDRQLWAGIYRALGDMPGAPDLAPTSSIKPPFDEPQTHLYVTTTLLNGETSRFTDSYGTIVQDVEHHGLFSFSDGDFTRPNLENTLAALALAARSSTSFPAAFEPAYVPYADSEAAAATASLPPRPAMGPFANITRAHWVADGGVLANRPIQPILQAIFDRPATVGAVRRVLLYIVPTAGGAPAMLTGHPGDDVNAPFDLAGGLLKDLSAVASQSIAGDFQAITDHNDRVRARADARLQLAEIASRLPDPASILTSQSLADYVDRESASESGPVIDAFMRRITTWPVAAPAVVAGQSDRHAIPEKWATFLNTVVEPEVQCRQGVPNGLRALWGTTMPESWADLSRFGRPAFDGAKGILLSLLRDAYRLADQPDARTRLATKLVLLHAALGTPARTNVQEFIDGACVNDDALREIDPPQVIDQLTRRWLDQRVTTDPHEDVATLLSQGWQALVAVFDASTITFLRDLTGQAPTSTTSVSGSYDERRQVAASHVHTYLTYLTDLGSAADQDVALRIALRLFSLHAARRAILPVSADLDQPVEFIQVSADTRTLLDAGRITARSKLTGMQLHHFGAFYKASWRVNDWMWGRLDGAGWLVHMLLDPSRVQFISHNLGTDGGTPAERFFNLLSQPELAGPFPAKGFPLASTSQYKQTSILTEEDVHGELSYLDDPTVTMPTSLPLTSLWVASAWQEKITAIELPVLADTVLNGPPGPASHSATDEAATVKPSSVQWATDVARLHKAGAGGLASYLRSCPVPQERFATEVGSSLLTRTLTHAAATATAAVNSAKQLPSVVRPVFTALRTVTVTGYRVTTLVDPRPRLLAALGLGALVLGVAGAIQQTTLVGIGGTVVALVGAYLLAIAAWGASRMLLVAMLTILIAAPVASLALPWVRRPLFGTSRTDGGFIGHHAYWLGVSWWHPFLALGIVLVVLALAGIVADPTGRRRKVS